MLWKNLSYFFILISIIINSSSFANPSKSFRQIVIFGDSYSDNGNTYRISRNTYPGQAYYLGHFLDGLNWSEYFSEKVGIDVMDPKAFRNFAYGQAQLHGSMTFKTHNASNPKIEWDFSVPDLAKEIDEYLSERQIDASRTLFFIFIGTNDFLNFIPKNDFYNQNLIYKEFEILKTQIKRLKRIGAKYIVVFNIRDLKIFPLTKQLSDQYENNYLDSLDKMIHLYNKLLINTYKKDKNIAIYNLYKLDGDLLKSKKSYQWYRQTFTLKEKLNPCYFNKGNYIDQVGVICNARSKYLFFDRIHQTTYINKVISDDVYAFLNRKHWID